MFVRAECVGEGIKSEKRIVGKVGNSAVYSGKQNFLKNKPIPKIFYDSECFYKELLNTKLFLNFLKGTLKGRGAYREGRGY